MIGIYKITSPSNKVYIGQTRNVIKRKSKYKCLDCKGQQKIYNSLVKYGWEQHNFEVIHELPNDVSQEVLDNYEILYINQYKDSGIELLNLRDGGQEQYKTLYERKTVRSNSKKGIKQTEESNKKRSDTLKGRQLSEMTEEKKEKISNTLKGRTSQFKGISQSKVKCPYCKKEGGKNLMTRYHFDNCKKINNINE